MYTDTEQGTSGHDYTERGRKWKLGEEHGEWAELRRSKSNTNKSTWQATTKTKGG